VQYNKNICLFYVLPGVLVGIGYIINISFNSINNLNLISYYGGLFPWLLYLAMPGIVIQNKEFFENLWKQYYYFMLIAVIAGLIEYYVVLTGLSSPKLISTSGGEFLSGKVSLFLGLEDGSIHYRFYGCFLEPGSLAMYLLPAIAYALYYNKYVGIILLPLGIYFSDSFGGIISGLCLIIIAVFVSLNKGRSIYNIATSLILVICLIIFPSVANFYAVQYEEKNESRIVREEAFSNTVSNIPAMIINNPIGYTLGENTLSNIESEYYYGANFTPGNALYMGGVISFIGYLFVLIVSIVASLMSILKRNLSRQQKTVFTSIIVLMPFIFQRSVVWDNAIYSLLFVPTILKYIEYKKERIIPTYVL